MSDRSNATEIQPQIDSRVDLFYLLTRAVWADRAENRKPREETSISNEQIEAYQKQNGTVL